MSTLPSLPPIDQGFLDAIQAERSSRVEPRWGSLLSPPESAWGRWSGAASSWNADQPVGQVVFALAHPPASCLQDPWGRALPARTHAAALASWGLLDLAEQSGLSRSQAEVLGLALVIQGRCPHGSLILLSALIQPRRGR